VPHDFDPGPVEEPFASLARDYPGAESYPAAMFRVEWGPIFHRGRLDGSARIVVIGQDPGQHEAIARRCMVGEAGQRVQGFLRKLGITRSYVIVNALLYSVYGQPKASELAPLEPDIAAYRHAWLDALLLDGNVKAVVAFGGLARQAFEAWWGPEGPRHIDLEFAALLHPTYPEGSRSPGGMQRMLDQWNEVVPRLRSAVAPHDSEPDLRPYGDDLRDDERAVIPEGDMPPGTPGWMRGLKQWAAREDLLGSDAPKAKRNEAKRATVVVKVPRSERPWEPLDR
jgi:uracil-DNA glycosylase